MSDSVLFIVATALIQISRWVSACWLTGTVLATIPHILVGAISVAQDEISSYLAFLVGADRSILGSELLFWRAPVG